MGNQTETGKAFEYACAFTAYKKYRIYSMISLDDSPQLQTAKKAFEGLSEKDKEEYLQAAEAALKVIDLYEPKLSESHTHLKIKLQTDSKGQEGDVRDVICIRGEDWEIGFSCKHNHEAVKHSRLSDTIDFGKDWFGKKCSEEYFKEVCSVFTPLRKIRDEGKMSGEMKTWDYLNDKENDCYVPILKAFMKELIKLDKQYPREIPASLIRYLIGVEDFYKVIMSKDITQVEVFNIKGTLNQPDKKRKPKITSKLIKLPSRFIEIDFKEGSKNTIEVICDEGWNVSMRIHNASSKIEPSLKFDVQLMATPSSIINQIQPWEELEFQGGGKILYPYDYIKETIVEKEVAEKDNTN